MRFGIESGESVAGSLEDQVPASGIRTLAAHFVLPLSGWAVAAFGRLVLGRP